MKKWLLSFALFFAPAFVHAYSTVFNPFTGKLDFVSTATTSSGGGGSGGLPLAGGGTNYVQIDPASNQSGGFNVTYGTITYGITVGTITGNGATLTNLNGSNVASGRISSTVLPSTVSYTTGAEVISGLKTFTASSTTWRGSSTVKLLAVGTSANGASSGAILFTSQDSGTPIVADTRMGGIAFGGRDSVGASVIGASIYGFATADYSSTKRPTKIVFSAAPASSTNQTEVMTMVSTGVVIPGVVVIGSNTIMNGATAYANGPLAVTSVLWPDGTLQVSSPIAGSGSGDITDVIAGTGLSGGAASGAATLNIVSTVAYQTSINTFTSSATFTSNPSISINSPLRINNIIVLSTAGTSNMWGGELTGAGITTGNQSTGFGYQACKAMTNSVNNTCFGFDAGLQLTGNNNTYIGSRAGIASVGGSGNIYIGYSAGDTESSSSNNFIAGSGLANITNAYFGSGITATSTANFILNGSGGSGTDRPGAWVGIAGGKGTGTGIGGPVLFQVAISSVGSSSGLNPLVTVGSFTLNGLQTDLGVRASSITLTGLTSNQCVQTGAGGILTTTGGVCGGGGSSSLFVATGVITGFALATSSPTSGINFSSSVFTAYVVGLSTAFVDLNYSSITAMGGTFNGASQLVRLNSSTQLPAVSGALLTNLNGSTIASGKVSSTVLPSTISYTTKNETMTGIKTLTSSQTIRTSSLGGLRIDLSGSSSGDALVIQSSGTGQAIQVGCLGQVGAEYPGGGCMVIDTSSTSLPSDGLLIFNNRGDPQIGQSLLRLWAANPLWNDPLLAITKTNGNSGPNIRLNGGGQVKIEFYDKAFHQEAVNGTGAWALQSGDKNFSIMMRDRKDTTFAHLVDFDSTYSTNSWNGGADMVLHSTMSLVFTAYNDSSAVGFRAPNTLTTSTFWTLPPLDGIGPILSDGNATLTISSAPWSGIWTLAQLAITIPGRSGQFAYCSNCTQAVCVSTGTGRGEWSAFSSRTTSCY